MQLDKPLRLIAIATLLCACGGTDDNPKKAGGAPGIGGTSSGGASSGGASSGGTESGGSAGEATGGAAGLGGSAGEPGSGGTAGSGSAIDNADRVCGTWVLQQVMSKSELDSLLKGALGAALDTPEIVGLSLRVPWKAIENDFTLLETGLAAAKARNIEFSVRFVAGRHTPAKVFDAGSPSYLVNGEKVPMPFFDNGQPNTIFEAEYDAFISQLAAWCVQNGVHLLHLPWYGQDWAELNNGKPLNQLPSYTYARWLTAHERLIDIALDHAKTGPAGKELSVELPLSGYGPLNEAILDLADHAIQQLGPSNPTLFLQANGWGPNGDWGAPDTQTEIAKDLVWQKKFARGEQAIQPGDYDWTAIYSFLYSNHATYVEIYTPSFAGSQKAKLAAEIVKFASSCETGALLP